MEVLDMFCKISGETLSEFLHVKKKYDFKNMPIRWLARKMNSQDKRWRRRKEKKNEKIKKWNVQDWDRIF